MRRESEDDRHGEPGHKLRRTDLIECDECCHQREGKRRHHLSHDRAIAHSEHPKTAHRDGDDAEHRRHDGARDIDPCSLHLVGQDVRVVGHEGVWHAGVHLPQPERADRRFNLQPAAGLLCHETEHVGAAAENERDSHDDTGCSDSSSHHPPTVPAGDDGCHKERGRPHFDPRRDGEDHGCDARPPGDQEHSDDCERNGDGIDASHSDRSEENEKGDPPPGDGSVHTRPPPSGQ